MSRKRALKKLQKRQDSARTRLEELYARGADDEFLALAAEEIKDPVASLYAAEWAEVAARVLRRSLGRADLGRLERLLPALRRGGLLAPEILLAEAVLDLAAGRLEAARPRLAELTEAAEGTAVFSRDLLAALQSLAQDRPDDRWPLDDPYLQAAGQLFRALQNLEAQAFAPSAACREDLARRLDDVRAAGPAAEAGEIHRLLDSAARCLSLLADLAALEDELDRLPESERSSASSRVLRSRAPGLLLTATLTASGPPLLAPLQHAVHLRWRAVLERVAAWEGPAGLTLLCAAEPRLLALDVSLPGGVPAGLARVRKGAEARQLLAEERHRELADLLHARGQTESDSGALAALWSLELWAACRWDADAPPMFFRSLGLLDLEKPADRALVRLQGMAGEIAHRFPAEQRAGVARRLRDELFDLCERADLGEPVGRATLSLLEHQPGDIGLLIVGLTGAIAGGDTRTLRALEDQLSRARAQGALTETPAIARRLMAQVALEAPPTIAQALDLLRPLFADGVWREIVELAAWTMSRGFASVLSEALFDLGTRGPRAGERAFASVRRELDRLRPALADTAGFTAMELALDYCQPGPIADKRLQKLLDADPGLDSALAAFLLLESISWGPHRVPDRVKRARNRLAPVVIERLDGRWELWLPAVEGLIIFGRREHLPRLEEKIQQALADPKLSPSGRQQLDEALQGVRRVLKPSPPPRRTVRKPRGGRRRSGTPQLELEIE